MLESIALLTKFTYDLSQHLNIIFHNDKDGLVQVIQFLQMFVIQKFPAIFASLLIDMTIKT